MQTITIKEETGGSKMSTGRLHSIESFGAVDGPGIRTVFFMQGCPARCLYCHNPDTWNCSGGRTVDVSEIIHWAERGKDYYGADGGVTFSGGEPLMQGKFVLEAMRQLKLHGIKTVIDTSATYIDDYTEDIIAEAQMLLLDVKHSDSGKFREISGCSQDTLLKVFEMADKHDTPLWIRQVIVPGINDTEENISALADFIHEHAGNNLYKAELLGYHTMALHKYEQLGIKYRLEGVEPMDREKLAVLSASLDEKLMFKGTGLGKDGYRTAKAG